MQDSPRVQSIDAFRGITMAGMVLVNLPGSWSHLYAPLRHAAWHGWTPTDFVFPFFLFAIGLSMAFSFAKRETTEPTSHAPLLLHILRRSAILFALGLFLNAFPKFDLAHLRIPGVLQRIALAYAVAALLCLFFRGRSLWWWSAGILLAYWVLMMWVPVPGYGAGQLTREGNWGAYLDRMLLGGHLYRKMWDPEGLLGTFPAAVSILAGYFTGTWCQSPNSPKVRLVGMFGASVALIVSGQLWHLWFPINKALWTSSYVLFTSGAALLLFGLCYWGLDSRRWERPFWPALIFGTNAIALYVMHILYIKIIRICIRFPLDAAGKKTISLYHWIYLHGFASWAGPLNGSLFFALAHVGLWFGVLWWFAHKRIMIKI